MPAVGFPSRVFPYPGNLIAVLHQLSGLYPYPFPSTGQAWFVDPVNGANGSNDGQSSQSAFASLTYALTKANAGDTIYLAPGQYDESPVVSREGADGEELNNLTIIGLGGRGAAYIEPTTEDASGLIVHADDVTLINVGSAGEDETSAVALTVTGARFRAYGCKFEGGLRQALVGPGTIALIDDGTKGTGADALFDDCEFAWGTEGLVLQGTDYGGCTQTYVRNCRFHDLTAESVGENVGSGGSAGVTFFGLNLRDSVFELDEAGAAPTKWISLNGDNANSGIVTGCQFPTALNSGKNLVSTKVLWTGNFHPAGLSTTQPS